MTQISKHYQRDRQYRENNIKEFLGDEGKVVFSTIMYNDKKQKDYRYEITDKAVLIVKATDADFIITKMLARPSRIKRVWADAPKEVIEIAIANARNPKRFA